MKKQIVKLLLLLFYVLNILGCTNKNIENNQNLSTPSQYSQYGEDFVQISSQLKSLISESNDMEFDCVNKEKYIYFTIWKEGVALQAIEAKKGDETSLEYWNRNINSYQQTALELYDYALQLGLKSKPFRFAVLNEQNKDKVLVIFENNKKIYDFVTD